MIGSTYLRKGTLFTKLFLTDDSRTVESETVVDWKNNRTLQDIKEYDLFDLHIADKTGLFFKLQASKTFFFSWRQQNKIRTAGYSAPCM
jgi:hypothetical protein